MQAAAQRSLPKIIPVYPTLRRIMQAASLQRDQRLSNGSELPEEISSPEGQSMACRELTLILHVGQASPSVFLCVI